MSIKNAGASVARSYARFPSHVRVDIPQSCVVATPRPLADAMARALGDLPRAQWLEPCVGDGVLLEALTAIGVPRSRIRALDISASIAPTDDLARTLRATEFLAWSARTTERFSRIIANPPFLALNRAPVEIQQAGLDVTIPSSGRRLTLRTNCWFAFLCSSINLLGAGGSLAFVLPAAWEYADYAALLRTAIPWLFEEVRVFRSMEPLFRVVQEGSIVLVARSYRPRGRDAKGAVHHHDYDTAVELISALRDAAHLGKSRSDRIVHIVTSSMLTGQESSQRGMTTSVTASLASNQLRVGDVFRIRLGGVTGDARFFLLSDSERKQRRLPASACRPVISRAHHLSKGAIDLGEWVQLKEDGERVWLFDPKPSQLTSPAVKEYLNLAPKNGGCQRQNLKIRIRNPWYRTPIPRQIDGFLSGMSGWGPWVVFRDMPDLAATNTLYVVQFIQRLARDDRAAWAMWLLTTDASRELDRIGRRYADGLVKYEPGDVADLPIRKPLRISGAFEDYLRAVRLLVKGRKAASRRVADAWFV
jgi:adenine-specific DNA-methyltransferase